MKKLLIVFFLLVLNFTLKAQYPVTQFLGSDSAVIYIKGAARTVGGFINGVYTDTAAANLQRIRQYAGAQIYTASDNSFWVRNSTATTWVKQATIADILTIIGCNSLVNGGVVTYSGTGLVFDVSPANYFINCGGIYNSPQTQVTLAAADPTNPRVDVIAVDTSGAVVVLTGTPAVNPVKPQVNTATQLELTHISVAAGATSPGGVTTVIIYDENTEWATSYQGNLVNFNNTANPFHLTKAAFSDLSAPITDAVFLFTKSGSPLNINDYSSLKFYIRIDNPATDGGNINVSLGNNNMKEGQVTVTDGSYGWSSGVVGSYQIITIPISDFQLSNNSISQLLIQPTNINASGLYIDYAQLQGGIQSGNSPYITNVYRKAATDSVFQVINNVPVFAFKDSTGGGTYTAGNGLTLSGSQFKLGSPLTENTTITTTGYDFNLPGIPTVSSTTGRKVALIDTATGKVERIDPASLGNSFSFGDTLFVNNISAIPTNEPEYEIAVFPDIQNMVRWSWAYGRPMYTWLRDSAAYYNVKAMVQVGDITDWNTQAEWDTVEAWNNYLPTNLPVLYVPGNHDYGTGFNPSGRDATRYKTEIANFYASRTGTTYGTYNSSPENNYMSFNAGSKKYFVLGLEFIPRDAVVTWASNVLDSLYSADPDREVIVVTHSYIDEKGERAKDTSDYSAAHYGMSADNDGQELWDKLIRKKKNIKWVFSGHHLIYNVDANRGLTQRIVSVGDHGNLINQIFVNYQDDVFWGDGYMLRLRFKPSEGTVTARFYSAYYNADDSRVASYVLEDPAINMASSVGVKTDLSVGRDLRVGGKLKVETLFPNRLVFSDSDGVVMGDAGLSFDKFNRKLNFPGGVINYPYTYLSIPSGQDQKLFSFRDSTGMELFYIKSFRASKTSFPTLHSNMLIGDSLGVPYGWNNVLLGTHLLAKAQWAVASTTSNALQGSQIGANVTGNFRWNVMMGQGLFNLATSGDDLTLIGQNVGNSMSSGTKVSALGSSAFSGLAVPVPISYSSGVGGNNFYNTASSYSVGVGYATGRNSSGDSAVLLGNRAGDGWTSIRQKLVIANSNTTSPLIYGEFDTPKVVINGRFEATDTAKFAKLRVTASPTAGYVLTSDADGNATWQPSSGGGTPGGSTKQFQYNNAGAFAGSGMLTQETNQILVTGVSDATTIPFAVEAHEDLTAPIIVAAQSGVKKIALHSNGSIEMQEVTDPTAAATGYNRLYAQAGKLYTHNDDGRVAQVIQNLQLVFGAGSGADSDTTAFTTSAIYGSFYNDADTIVVTSFRAVLQGTSPDVTYKIWYNDSLNVEAGATALNTSGNQVTSTTTGTNVTSITNTKIPPGVWVWVKTSTVATKPKYFSLTLNGYRK